eukprot:3940651-Rhodomonas_salina.2
MPWQCWSCGRFGDRNQVSCPFQAMWKRCPYEHVRTHIWHGGARRRPGAIAKESCPCVAVTGQPTDRPPRALCDFGH